MISSNRLCAGRPYPYLGLKATLYSRNRVWKRGERNLYRDFSIAEKKILRVKGNFTAQYALSLSSFPAKNLFCILLHFLKNLQTKLGRKIHHAIGQLPQRENADMYSCNGFPLARLPMVAPRSLPSIAA